MLDLNAFEFNLELLIHLELMPCETTCIFIIRLMLGVILIKHYFEKLEFRCFFPDFGKPRQTA